MDFSFFESIYSDYGIHAIISAILICAFRFILKKFCAEKINNITRLYLEMSLAFTIELVFILVFVGDIKNFDLKAVSSALISYSTALIMYSLISRLIKGKSIKQDSRSLLIETLIEDYVLEEKKSSLANEILIILLKEDLDKELLCSIIIDNQVRPFDLDEITALADIIIDSIKNVN